MRKKNIHKQTYWETNYGKICKMQVTDNKLRIIINIFFMFLTAQIFCSRTNKGPLTTLNEMIYWANKAVNDFFLQHCPQI